MQIGHSQSKTAHLYILTLAIGAMTVVLVPVIRNKLFLIGEPQRSSDCWGFVFSKSLLPLSLSEIGQKRNLVLCQKGWGAPIGNGV